MGPRRRSPGAGRARRQRLGIAPRPTRGSRRVGSIACRDTQAEQPPRRHVEDALPGCRDRSPRSAGRRPARARAPTGRRSAVRGAEHEAGLEAASRSITQPARGPRALPSSSMRARPCHSGGHPPGNSRARKPAERHARRPSAPPWRPPRQAKARETLTRALVTGQVPDRPAKIAGRAEQMEQHHEHVDEVEVEAQRAHDRLARDHVGARRPRSTSP